MEETPPFTFSSHRNSHLKSQTYRTLVRILSQPQLFCQSVPLPPPDKNYDGNGQRHVFGNQACSRHGQLFHESLPDNNGQEKEFSETQVVINEIENIMRIEEDEASGTGLQDRNLFQAQNLLIDELKHVMKGNEELVCHNNSDSVTNRNQNSGDNVAVSNNQGEHFELHPTGLEEFRGVGQLQLDEEAQCQNNTMSCEVLKPVDNCEESSLLMTNGLKVDNEMLQKEIMFDKSVCADSTMGYPTNTIEDDDEIEEGEVSGEFEVDNGSVTVFSEDAVVPQEKKVDEKQASEAIIDKNGIPFDDKNQANKKDSWFSSFMVDTVENAKDRREVEAQQHLSSQMACKRKVVTYEDPILAEEGVWCKNQKKYSGAGEQNEGRAATEHKRGSRVMDQKRGNVASDGLGCAVVCPSNLALCTEKSDETAFANQGIASKEKDAGLCNNKKRGPPSKEKKAKKKQKERKKRAEKNRQCGVKRMKLHPVLNPKPVSHCRHYLKGRCREGEKCKFSHDTIPLTKFEPCHHFARQKCMKGDSCPYDHQLSKYPCTNYVSKGYCIRGESCLFSHKLPVQKDFSSTSNVCTPNLKHPCLPSTSDSKGQLDTSGTSKQTAKALPDSTGVISDRHAALNVGKALQNLPALVPKGISFISGGKPSMVESSPKRSSPSLKSNELIKVGNQIDQCASVTVQNCNEISNTVPPVVAPKGINFLSFGRAPLDKRSSTMKLTSAAINQENGAHLFSSKNFVVHEAYSSPSKDNSVLVGEELHQSVSNMAHRLNKMLQKTEPAACQDASIDRFRRNPQPSLPLSSDTGVHASFQESKNASNKHQESSALQGILPSSPVGSGQSSDQLEHGCLKNAPISSQKALMSTLAFAAKVESLMKKNQSSRCDFAIGNAVSKENRGSTTPGGLQFDSEKASKVLDFLSGISGEKKL